MKLIIKLTIQIGLYLYKKVGLKLVFDESSNILKKYIQSPKFYFGLILH